MAVAVLAVLAALLLPLPGCVPSATDRALDRAEALMEEHPDSAYGIIMEIDSMTRQRSPRAKVLEYEARYMLDMYPAVNDSSLSSDPDRYLRHDASSAMKLRYLMAYDLFNKEECDSSIALLLPAIDLADRTDDDLWKGRILQLIGMSYNHLYNNLIAIRYLKGAKESFLKAGKNTNALYNDLDIALCYSGLPEGMNGDTTAISILDRIRKDYGTMMELDSGLNYQFHSVALAVNNKIGNLPAATASYKALARYPADYLTSLSDEAQKARYLLLAGDYAGALSLAQSVLDSDPGDSEKVIAYDVALQCNMRSGNIERAFEIKDSIYALQNRCLWEIVDRSVLDYQNLYNEKKAESALQKSKEDRTLLIIVLIAFAVLLTAGVMVYRLTVKVKNFRIKAYLYDLENVKETLESLAGKLRHSEQKGLESETMITTLREEKESLSEALRKETEEHRKETEERRKEDEKRIKEDETRRREDEERTRRQEIRGESRQRMTNGLIREISRYYSDIDTSSVSRGLVLDSIRKIYDRMKSAEFMTEVEDLLNGAIPGFSSRLRQECKGLTEDEIRFVSLVASGFDPMTISVLLGFKRTSYAKKKARIIQKIKESEVSDSSVFIDILSPKQ